MKHLSALDDKPDLRHRIVRSNTQPRTSPNTPTRSSGSSHIPGAKAVRTPPRGLGLADASRLEGLSCAGHVKQAAPHTNAARVSVPVGTAHVSTSSPPVERERAVSSG